MFGNSVKKLLKKKEEEENEGGENKRKIENIVFLIILVIITVVIINLILKDDNNKSTTDQNVSSKTKQLASTFGLSKKEETVETNANNSDLKKDLEEILKKIQGVEDVNVFINYSESSETVAMYNENSKTTNTEEADTSGGTRKIEENDTQKEVIYQENNGEKVPITQKVVSPKIEGAIITAKGADNANVKTSIIQAVEAATRIAYS